jgi:hypothetical protein
MDGIFDGQGGFEGKREWVIGSAKKILDEHTGGVLVEKKSWVSFGMARS